MGALHSLYHLNRLRRRLDWSGGKLEDLRRRKLADLLDYCYQHIPYYRKQFDQIGAEPRDFRTPEDLVRFPILEKETLRDQSGEFIDPDGDNRSWITYRSSGSTGIPLELRYHPSERLRMGFTVTRELLYNGLKPHYRIVNITEPRHSAPKERWYHRLGFMNEQFLSVYDCCELNVERLRAAKPHVIIGFPSSLMVIGEEISRSLAKPLSPRLIFTLAEVLTDQDREILTRQWGVNPIDLYGANEVGHIAFQCGERSGYHVNADSLYVEVLDEDRPVEPGGRGEVVVTNFDLRVMPIIRYRVGDVVHRSERNCSCGCSFPLLQRIHGRSDGFIIGSGGKLYSALEISLLMKAVRALSRFRIIQETEKVLIVEWVASDPESDPTSQIRTVLVDRLGGDIRIETRRVEVIPREKSGKIRSVVSSLPHPFREGQRGA
jgi:phenylacetate-CoA ligase